MGSLPFDKLPMSLVNRVLSRNKLPVWLFHHHLPAIHDVNTLW